MSSKYELTISTDYVSDWTVVEAVRELFQNALDNEIENSENKMSFIYKDNSLEIANKTSVLEVSSLLLGKSSKRDNDNTIGKHGEGYKVALVTLLRLGKSVTIYNYGKKEVWTTKLVKSRRYGGVLVPQVIIDSFIWKKAPSSDLIIKVDGITEEDYALIVDSNLHLKEVEKIEPAAARGNNTYGSILLGDNEKGRVYVEGLYVETVKDLKYGYNFKARYLSLDRDRRLVKMLDLLWLTGKMWAAIDDISLLKGVIKENIKDIAYLVDSGFVCNFITKAYENKELLEKELEEEFIEEYGEDAVPVSDDEELCQASSLGLKPVLISSEVQNKIYIKYKNRVIDKAKSAVEDNCLRPKELLGEWFEKIRHKLSDEEVSDFEVIYADLN